MQYMKHRQPFNLEKILKYYNILQIGLSVWIFTLCFKGLKYLFTLTDRQDYVVSTPNYVSNYCFEQINLILFYFEKNVCVYVFSFIFSF